MVLVRIGQTIWQLNHQVQVVLNGKAKLRIGTGEKVLGPGEAALIPANIEHQLQVLEDLELINCKSVVLGWSVYPEPRGPRVLPVGEWVLWYGMFAPCWAFLGNHGLCPWGFIMPDGRNSRLSKGVQKFRGRVKKCHFLSGVN